MTTAPVERVGFVGIGAMGLPMASRLAERGHVVLALDPNGEQVDRALAAGLAASTDPVSLRDCKALIVLVANGQQLLSLIDGELFRVSTSVASVIVMSTVGVDAVRDFAQRLAPLHITVIDSPVTGGVVGAQSGRLTMFAAGDPSDVEASKGLLDAFGRVERCGDAPGQGQAFKLVNQLLAATNLAASAEALALARALGLDANRALALISGGAGGSWMLSDRGERMLTAPEGRPCRTQLNILAKDVDLVMAGAGSISFDAPMARSAASAFHTAIAAGLGNHDDSSLIDVFVSDTPQAGA
jgi:3-hydroxyisobutyrate dehydrogenase